jgi:hypothetical protein
MIEGIELEEFKKMEFIKLRQSTIDELTKNWSEILRGTMPEFKVIESFFCQGGIERVVVCHRPTGEFFAIKYKDSEDYSFGDYGTWEGVVPVQKTIIAFEIKDPSKFHRTENKHSPND